MSTKKKDKSERHMMIHRGKGKVVTPAVTRVVVDPETGEESEEIVEEAVEETIELAKGSKFGRYPIGVPVEVTNADERKALLEKGFEDHTPTAKEAKAIDSRIVRDNGLSGRLADVAERDRLRALGRVRAMPDAKSRLAPEALAEVEKAEASGESPEVFGGNEGGNK
jgi:hypothetical protein